MKLIDWTKPLIDRNGKKRIYIETLILDGVFYTANDVSKAGAILIPHDKHGRCIDRAQRGCDVVNDAEGIRMPLDMNAFRMPTMIKSNYSISLVLLATPTHIVYFDSEWRKVEIKYAMLAQSDSIMYANSSTKELWKPCYTEKKSKTSELFAIHEEDEEDEEEEDEEDDDLKI